MGVALAPELRAVGSLCGGVCAACGGVAPWGWRCSGLPDASRRGAGFWCGRAGRPPPGMTTGGSGAPMAVWAFLYEHSPHFAKESLSQASGAVRSTVAAFA